MNMNLLKKLKSLKCVLLLMIVTICIFCIGLQQKLHIRNISKISGYFNLSNGKLQLRENLITTLNSHRKKKLDTMKQELNVSKDIDSALYAPRKGRYLLLDPNICKGVQRVDIIIIVHTAPAHLERRQRMRNSFANRFLFQPFEVRIAFLLGITENRTLETILKQEYERYKDTVMGDFIDSYHNLSLKGVMGYHWVSEHCSNSDIVLKIDDDVLINMFKLLYYYFPYMRGKKKSMFCHLWHKGTMLIYRFGKWNVESHLFPSMSTYPYDYCGGYCVMLTSDLVRLLYEASLRTPFFWIDDIYLFGMLPYVVGGVTYYNFANYVLFDHNEAKNCTLSKGLKCPILGTLISDDSYWSYWNLTKELYTSKSFSEETKYVH